MLMKNPLGLALAIALFATLPAFAQRDEKGHDQQKHEEAKHVDRNPPRANGGHIPPAPQARQDRQAPREAERFEDGRENHHPHVANDHFYGHESAGDARFHIDHPYEHGRFERFGPSYRYKVLRFDRDHHRFWFPGGFGFEIAPWDWAAASNWCWDCGADDFVVYDDADHVGWYMLYNVHTGVYVHVQYLGH
jgi:hypothetical protein